MRIHYHEAGVLARLPMNGRTPCLQKAHKQAWDLFTYGLSASEKRFESRPFLFRMDQFDERRCLFTIRADMPFPGSRPTVVDLEDGQELAIDLMLTPVRRNGKSQREFTPDRDEWPLLWTEKLNKLGLSVTPEDVSLLELGRWRWNDAGTWMDMVDGRARVRVTDAGVFCAAWLNGIGRRKAYGLGMPRLALS